MILATSSKSTGKKPGRATSKKGAQGQKTKHVAKRRKPTKKGGLVKMFSRFWLALLAFFVGLTAITLVWALNLSPPVDSVVLSPQPPSPVASSVADTTKPPPPAASVAKITPPKSTTQVRAKLPPQPSLSLPQPRATGRVYEVFDSELLEQKIKEVDLVLVQTIMALDLDPRQVRHLDIQVKSSDGEKYHTQSLAIALDPDKHGFVDLLKDNLQDWVEGVQLQPVRKDPLKQEWRISLLNLPTHTLFLEFNGRKQEVAPQPRMPAGTGPRLVVIIDDLGESLHQAKEFLSLKFPVTFAVLPHSGKTREVARLAAEQGRDVLLHQPMEPRDYPHRADPGPGALFVDMPAEQILAVLAENLAQVPQAIGVNNHMGSRFTADNAGMATVFQELKWRGLFFLDSLTTGDSVAQQQARGVGLTHLRRHIFLDNVQNVQAILFQLRKAESLALTSEPVIAIGHPYPETLEALRIWEMERDQRIQLVSVSDLVPRPALAGR